MPHENQAKCYDHIYANTYGPAYSRFTDNSMAAIEQLIGHHLPVTPKPVRILDYGAGTGRLSILMARLGYPVTAVEPSIPMADVLEGKAQNAKLHIDIHRTTIAGYQGGSADLALAVFTVMNYIIENGEMKESLANIHRHLDSGGLFFFDLADEVFFNNPNGMTFGAPPCQKKFWIQRDIANVFRYREEWSCICEGEAHQGSEEFKLRRWLWPEMEGMMREVGFMLIQKGFDIMRGSGATYALFRKP